MVKITIPETRWNYGVELWFGPHYCFVELRWGKYLILNKLTGRVYAYPFKKYPDV